MSKIKIAGATILAVLVLYLANTVLGSASEDDAQGAKVSAMIYENCKMRNEATVELGLDSELEDCTAQLLQAH